MITGMGTAIPLVIAAALALGFIANARVRNRLSGDLAAKELVAPIQTLVVLVMAFLLVSASQSYGRAREAAAAEARAVDHLFETAAYAPEPQRRDIQAYAVCYSRAVVHAGWQQLGEQASLASAPSRWSSRIRVSFEELVPKDSPAFSLLVQADRDRANARATRVTEALPTIPGVVFAFLLAALAAAVFVFGFAIPSPSNPAERLTVVVISALFVGGLLLIRDLDRPFDGLTAMKPTAMTATSRDIGRDFSEAYGPKDLPCDGVGGPVGA